MTGQDSLLPALCDTFVPGIQTDEQDAATRELLARPASAVGVADAIRQRPNERLVTLLGEDFHSATLSERTRRVQSILAAGGDDANALRSIRSEAIALFYGLVDENERNPNWAAIGYPGPISKPPSPDQAPKLIPTVDVPAGGLTLEADACVVGSGAGGSVIAARLQQAGRSVVLLEMGGYTNESDLTQVELHDGARTYLNGGPFFSEEGTVGILAGSTLGGGTFVNSLVCLPPPDDVRAEWAAHGLDGVDGPEFDGFVEAVWERLGVNTEATIPNRSNGLMTEALEQLGHSWQLLPRNAGEHDPRHCGYCNTGCQRGEKNSTLKTYLQDAADAGCCVIVGCLAEQVLVEGGRTVGMSGWATTQDGTRVPVSVRAPIVVAAAGGIGTPALLLRSGIGGRATGKYLRLHPAWFVGGVHGERLDAWTGQIQSVVSLDFRRLDHGGGFLPECVILSPTFWTSSMPWDDGEQHKRDALKLSRVASWHALTLDHGWGEVRIDASGKPTVRWKLSDGRDRASAADAVVQLARMHEAVGANEVFTFDPPGLRWRRGQDFDEYLEALRRFDWRRALAYSAHQMCSARMGADRQTSVANVDGELHDTPGVWVGDASAMPSSPGVNPMIALMALAERTAARILAR